MTKILVSACLLGENCKYSGSNNKNEDVIALAKDFQLIPVCPECFGGLAIPRPPAEIKEGRVFAKDGTDVTRQFEEGAEHTLYIAQENNCPAALLKERSPSCGSGKIYDGTFTGTLIDGDGITAALLKSHQIAVFGESQIRKLKELYGTY